MQPPSNPPGEEKRGERGREGFGKRVCASKSSQYLCNRIVSPYEESLLGKQGEKKKSVAERESVRFRKGARGRETGVARGGGCERGERRRIMKTTMGERARLKLAQFCSRRRARTTTTAVVVAAQYRV